MKFISDDSHNDIYQLLCCYKYVVLYVNGPMGVGKTTFSRNLCNLFNGHSVNSSSFSLINIEFADRTIIHADFYRQAFSYELFEYEVLPHLSNSYIILFEWCKPLLLDNNAHHFTLDISYKDGSRQYVFKSFATPKSILAMRVYN